MDEHDVQHSAAPSLARLFNLEAEPDRWADNDLAGIWRHLLRSPAAAEIPGCGLDPRVTLEQVLHEAQGGVAALEAVKERAKTLRQPGTPLPANVASLLYYAAIAAALVHHQARISSLEPAALAKGLNWALSLPWINAPTGDLLRRAQANV